MSDEAKLILGVVSSVVAGTILIFVLAAIPVWYAAGIQQRVWERQGIHMTRWEVFMGAHPIQRVLVDGTGN